MTTATTTMATTTSGTTTTAADSTGGTSGGGTGSTTGETRVNKYYFFLRKFSTCEQLHPSNLQVYKIILKQKYSISMHSA